MEYGPRFVTANRKQFRALLARMLENQLIDKARGHGRRRALWDGETLGRESRLSLDPDLARPTQPDAAAERNEEVAWMQLGLEFLGSEERDVVHRRQFEEQSFADIGDALGTSPDAVRKRFNRAVLRLAGIVQNLQGGQADTLLGDAG